ncbi:hypothetical protein PRIPAC_79543 [Pristionchus pacificus]|uniref:Tyrosine phosphatase n=1 Tax=Pristionchus pacificus TaxID=54126 RepID=A0A2A6CLV6_PRIPA|nr:hypothetical protein PRIPAC_79543 [Pristionchus pacificus]|eukprot:PDM79089.1 tyrosine phosphatase [Pristionchus pacificus]
MADPARGDTNFIRQFWPNQQELKDFGFIRIKCEDFDEMKIALRKVEARPKPPSLDAPVLLVCPSGVHRAGTFAGLDIVLDRISAERKVGLAETVSILRTQRFGVFSMFQHYQTVADIIVNPDALLGKMA